MCLKLRSAWSSLRAGCAGYRGASYVKKRLGSGVEGSGGRGTIQPIAPDINCSNNCAASADAGVRRTWYILILGSRGEWGARGRSEDVIHCCRLGWVKRNGTEGPLPRFEWLLPAAKLALGVERRSRTRHPSDFLVLDSVPRYDSKPFEQQRERLVRELPVAVFREDHVARRLDGLLTVGDLRLLLSKRRDQVKHSVRLAELS